MRRSRILKSVLVTGAGLLFAQGCARSQLKASTGAVTPGLTQEDKRHGRAGTDPNAPFVLVTRETAAAPAAHPVAGLDAPPCTPEGLGVVEVAEQVNGDDRFVSLAFVNDGPGNCKLGGYPALSLLNEDGQPIGSLSIVQVADQSKLGRAAETNAASPSEPIELMLAPNGEAYFGISWTSGTQCPAVAGLAIRAPGMTRSFKINHPLTVCSGQVRVTALRSTQNAS